jgi:hypothetical protein
VVQNRNALFAIVLETNLFDDGDVLNVARCSSVEPLTFWIAAVIGQLAAAPSVLLLCSYGSEVSSAATPGSEPRWLTGLVLS